MDRKTKILRLIFLRLFDINVSIICVRYKFDCGVITRSENLRSLELCDPVHLFAGEVEALVRQSLEELPELTRYIFIDQRLKGKSYRDIAVEYAISERRVETELARALDKLRRRLKDYLPVILVSLVLSRFIR